MSCLYVVDTKRKEESTGSDHFLAGVLPIIQEYGGSLLMKLERDANIRTILRFPSRDSLEKCVGCREFQRLQRQRVNTQDYAFTLIDMEGIKVRS